MKDKLFNKFKNLWSSSPGLGDHNDLNQYSAASHDRI